MSYENHNSVKVTLLIEPHYLPSIAFFGHALAYDKLCIEQHANFQRSSYANRTYIAGANGKQRLSIPLKGGSRQKCMFKDIQMDFTENWLKEHWFAIQSAYAKAAFFEYYESEIKAFFETPEASLLQWNLNWMQWLCTQLNWQASISLSNQYLSKNNLINEVCDMRHTILPNTNYTQLLKGVQYYQLFQEKNGFQNNLSVLDMLMSKGPDALSLLKKIPCKKPGKL